MTIKAGDLNCRKIQGGKNTLWHAKHPSHNIVGAGNSADNAIKDFQAQHREGQKRTMPPPASHSSVLNFYAENRSGFPPPIA
jgi:hypothetical protein